MNHRFTIATVCELLAVREAGERGFAACADRARDSFLKRAFTERARRHLEAAAELRDLIIRLGGDPTVPARALGAGHRGWARLHAALRREDDTALVDECERGDDYTLEVYRNALDDHLPEFVRHRVLLHFEELMSVHDRIRFLPGEQLTGGGLGVAGSGEHARP
jgi:uncharacterized protein (TIGR02284 family)